MSIKERPIIMTGESVRGILAGRKTMTRRVIKRQPTPTPARISGPAKLQGDAWDGYFMPESNSGKVGIFEPYAFLCPHGLPGDRLWVRETWSLAWTPAAGCGIHYLADDEYRYEDNGQIEIPPSAWHNLYELPEPQCSDNTHPRKVRSPLFMPRWASRLTLEIVSVRAERLQDITEEDAFAEGVTGYKEKPGDKMLGYPEIVKYHRVPECQFQRLWDSINGKRPGCAWSENPWCWVIEFKRLEQAQHDNDIRQAQHD